VSTWSWVRRGADGRGLGPGPCCHGEEGCGSGSEIGSGLGGLWRAEVGEGAVGAAAVELLGVGASRTGLRWSLGSSSRGSRWCRRPGRATASAPSGRPARTVGPGVTSADLGRYPVSGKDGREFAGRGAAMVGGGVGRRRGQGMKEAREVRSLPLLDLRLARVLL
jgi:hypothetical protein